MKNYLFSIFAAIALISCTNAPLELAVMSFNIRLDTPTDSLNAWPYRKDVAAEAIRLQDADIVGTQEVLYHQLTDLKERLPEYDHLGVGRSDGKEGGEFSAILYKKDRFKVVESGTFWLSETPETPGSKGWDAACERVATWGIFEDLKLHRRFLAMNTHLDHVGREARSNGVDLILSRIAELRQDLPVVLTGDFNIRPDNPAIARVIDASKPDHLVHTRDVAPIRSGFEGTFHAYGRIPVERRSTIDYIFVSEDAETMSYSVLDEKAANGVYLSDHAPVVAKIRVI